MRVDLARSPTSLMPGYYVSPSQLRFLVGIHASLAVSLYISDDLE